MPLVSVISVFYNRGGLVDFSVKSLVEQTYLNIEVILVDDGSTDNTLEELRKFESENVKVVTHENCGFVFSVKKAVEEISSGELIAIHGSGDYSLASRIEKQVEFLQEHPQVGVVGCGREIINNNVAIKNIAHTFFGKNEVILRKGSPVSHGEVMMRRDIYDLVGGYRTEFTYAQDYDLWLRMNEHCSISRIPCLLYREFGQPAGVRNSLEKTVIQQKLFELARVRAQARLASGNDIINHEDDIFSPLVGSAEAAHRFFVYASISAVEGNTTWAKRFAKESLAIKITPKAMVLLFIIHIPPLRYFFSVIVGRYFARKQGHNLKQVVK